MNAMISTGGLPSLERSANITSPCDIATVRGCCVARHQSFVVPSYEPSTAVQLHVALPVTRRLFWPQSFTWRALHKAQAPHPTLWRLACWVPTHQSRWPLLAHSTPFTLEARHEIMV